MTDDDKKKLEDEFERLGAALRSREDALEVLREQAADIEAVMGAVSARMAAIESSLGYDPVKAAHRRAVEAFGRRQSERDASE